MDIPQVHIYTCPRCAARDTLGFDDVQRDKLVVATTVTCSACGASAQVAADVPYPVQQPTVTAAVMQWSMAWMALQRKAISALGAQSG